MAATQEPPRFDVILHRFHKIGQLILLAQQSCLLLHELFDLVCLLLQLHQILIPLTAQLACPQLEHIDLPLLFRNLGSFSV